jgi:hypothetical protein
MMGCCTRIHGVEISGCVTGRVVKVIADKESMQNNTSDKKYSGKHIGIFLKKDRFYPVNMCVCVIAVQRYVEYYLFSKVLIYFRKLRLSLLRVISCLFLIYTSEVRFVLIF